MMAGLFAASMLTTGLGVVVLYRILSGRHPVDIPVMLILTVGSGVLTLVLLISARMAG